MLHFVVVSVSVSDDSGLEYFKHKLVIPPHGLLWQFNVITILSYITQQYFNLEFVF